MSGILPSLTILSEEYKFNGDNLLQWNTHITQLLGAKGLLGYIDGKIPKPVPSSTRTTSVTTDTTATTVVTPIYSTNPTLDEWTFRDQLARGHVTLNCTDVASLGVIATGTAKEAYDSIQNEWGKSTDMRRSHAQEALNRTVFSEGSEIQDHIKLLRTRKVAVDNLNVSPMDDETWRGLIIRSISPTAKWLPVIPSLYTMGSSADIISTLLAHGMILGREIMMTTAAHPLSTALAVPYTNERCKNPNCKAKKPSSHTTEDCYWPGGGKEGQFPANFGQTSKQTEHFALSARRLDTPGQPESGVLIDNVLEVLTNDEAECSINQEFQDFEREKMPTFMNSTSDTITPFTNTTTPLAALGNTETNTTSINDQLPTAIISTVKLHIDSDCCDPDHHSLNQVIASANQPGTTDITVTGIHHNLNPDHRASQDIAAISIKSLPVAQRSIRVVLQPSQAGAAGLQSTDGGQCETTENSGGGQAWEWAAATVTSASEIPTVTRTTGPLSIDIDVASTISTLPVLPADPALPTISESLPASTNSDSSASTATVTTTSTPVFGLTISTPATATTPTHESIQAVTANHHDHDARRQVWGSNTVSHSTNTHWHHTLSTPLADHDHDRDSSYDTPLTDNQLRLGPSTKGPSSSTKHVRVDDTSSTVGTSTQAIHKLEDKTPLAPATTLSISNRDSLRLGTSLANTKPDTRGHTPLAASESNNIHHDLNHPASHDLNKGRPRSNFACVGVLGEQNPQIVTVHRWHHHDIRVDAYYTVTVPPDIIPLTNILLANAEPQAEPVRTTSANLNNHHHRIDQPGTGVMIPDVPGTSLTSAISDDHHDLDPVEKVDQRLGDVAVIAVKPQLERSQTLQSLAPSGYFQEGQPYRTSESVGEHIVPSPGFYIFTVLPLALVNHRLRVGLEHDPSTTINNHQVMSTGDKIKSISHAGPLARRSDLSFLTTRFQVTGNSEIYHSPSHGFTTTSSTKFTYPGYKNTHWHPNPSLQVSSSRNAFVMVGGIEDYCAVNVCPRDGSINHIRFIDVRHRHHHIHIDNIDDFKFKLFRVTTMLISLQLYLGHSGPLLSSSDGPSIHGGVSESDYTNRLKVPVCYLSHIIDTCQWLLSIFITINPMIPTTMITPT
jgi:hypothetical protein